MTNSAKQIKQDKASVEAEALPSYITGDYWNKALARYPVLTLVSLLVGWVFILHINRWHFTTPVLMLWFGWAGILATIRFMWAAGVAMATDVDAIADRIDLSASRLRELEGEKKVLVRAIKEIEFDRDLGKMSAEDAKEIMRFYRARAIDVIKEIDGQQESELTIAERVERDLAARLAVEVKPKKKTKAKTSKPDQAAPRDKESDVAATSDSDEQDEPSVETA